MIITITWAALAAAGAGVAAGGATGIYKTRKKR